MVEGVRQGYSVPVSTPLGKLGRRKAIENYPIVLWGHHLFIFDKHRKGAKEPMIVVSDREFSSHLKLYRWRWGIEHFFRFGKQRLGLVNSQTCETRHEENWHWIGLLTYSMLYHARKLTQPVAYPWEKRKVHVIATTQRPSQVQRDYARIIRGIGTPAPVPKPRGKPPGRPLGYKSGERQDHPLILKSSNSKKGDPLDNDALSQKEPSPKRVPKPPRKPRKRYVRMKRVWAKKRVPRKKKEPLIKIYLV